MTVDAPYATLLVDWGSRGMTGPQRFVLGSVPNRISHRASAMR